MNKDQLAKLKYGDWVEIRSGDIGLVKSVDSDGKDILVLLLWFKGSKYVTPSEVVRKCPDRFGEVAKLLKKLFVLRKI